ncbi:MAG: TonB-dependent receptor plug domain-containing protein, partial [Verrucomicrobiae bacterium]|nr:TonB-dependent receptor plug domain-containing protein [Verrucomicrobiae bacterium]
MPHSLRFVLPSLMVCGLFVGSPILQAQEDKEDKDIFTLNPFSVDEEDNVGYLARSSLAGTRIKAPLSDLAATISVVTEEFLDDTGSTDLQELLVYTSNTEVLGIGGNFANPNTSIVVGAVEDSQFRSPNTNTRVRGLAAADLTRDYNATSVPFDSYNTSRVVINRGANAILFGLGSPAGIINNQIKTPVFEDHGEVTFQVGSYDSHRSEIDVEQVLVDEKLSLRVMGLNEERFYQQDPAFEHDKRITAVGEWRPFENTSVRLSYESGSITANRPRTLPPQDMVTRWFDVSPTGQAKPTHDPHNLFQLFLYDDEGNNVDNLYWGPIGFTFEAAAAYAGPQYGVAGGALPNGTDGFVPIINNRYGPDASNGIAFQSFVTIRGVNQLYGNMLGNPTDQNGNPKSATRDFYVNEHITDTSLFDFRNKLFDGPNKGETEKFDVMTGSIEQTFLDGNAGVAYHYNREEYRNRFWNVIGDGSRYGAIG